MLLSWITGGFLILASLALTSLALHERLAGLNDTRSLLLQLVGLSLIALAGWGIIYWA